MVGPHHVAPLPWSPAYNTGGNNKHCTCILSNQQVKHIEIQLYLVYRGTITEKNSLSTTVLLSLHSLSELRIVSLRSGLEMNFKQPWSLLRVLVSDLFLEHLNLCSLSKELCSLFKTRSHSYDFYARNQSFYAHQYLSLDLLQSQFSGSKFHS